MEPIHTSSKGVGIFARHSQEGNLQYITQHGDLIWDTSLHDPEILFLALAADAAPSCGPVGIAGSEDGVDDWPDDHPQHPHRRIDDPGFEPPAPDLTQDYGGIEPSTMTGAERDQRREYDEAAVAQSRRDSDANRAAMKADGPPDEPDEFDERAGTMASDDLVEDTAAAVTEMDRGDAREAERAQARRDDDSLRLPTDRAI